AASTRVVQAPVSALALPVEDSPVITIGPFAIAGPAVPHGELESIERVDDTFVATVLITEPPGGEVDLIPIDAAGSATIPSDPANIPPQHAAASGRGIAAADHAKAQASGLAIRLQQAGGLIATRDFGSIRLANLFAQTLIHPCITNLYSNVPRLSGLRRVRVVAYAAL